MLNSLTPVDGSELLLVNQDGRTVLVNRPQAVTILALGGAMSRPGKSLLTERTGTERFQALQGGNMIEMSLVDLTAYLAGTATPGIVPANRAADFFTGRERFMIHQGAAVAAGDISQTLYIRGTGGSLQGLGGNFPVDGGPVPLGIYGSPGSAILNASAAFTPTISGGTAPYTLSVASGALPAGVTRSGNSLTGTYTTLGAYSYTLRATDSSNPAQTADLLVSGTVANAPTLNALTVSGGSGTIGTALSSTISGLTSGSSVALSGAGAAGLSISGAVITGTPTTAGAVNLVETLAGATNSPRTTGGVITVSAASTVSPLAGYNFVMTRNGSPVSVMPAALKAS